MAAHPRRKCLTRKPLGHVDVIVAFASKIEDLRDIDVPQFLRCRYMLLKPLTLGWIDTLSRDQRHIDWLTGSLIHGFVAGGGTGDIGCVRGAVMLKTDAVILEKCRALHKTGLLGHGATTIWLHRHSFNRDFGCQLLGICVRKSVISGSPTAGSESQPFTRIHFGNCAGGEIRESKLQIRVPRGVTVTQRPLEALFMVRIHAG